MSEAPPARRRRGGKWSRLGEIRPEIAGAPAVARRLAVRNAWQKVAGPLLAARLPVLDRRRDTLVLAVPDKRWLASLPAIEARVLGAMAAHPALRGIRRLEGHVREGLARPVAPAPPAAAPPVAPDAPGEPRQRLAALAERLLRRKH